MPTIAKIRPFLWFPKGAREAAEFYASVFPDSSVGDAYTLNAESPVGPPGSVEVVSFRLAGQQLLAMTAGPMDPFNHAISLYVLCEDQAELDRYWDALLDGGKTEACGWLSDRYGVHWQIVPRRLEELMGHKDKEISRRAGEAMLKMIKIDVAELERAVADKAA